MKKNRNFIDYEDSTYELYFLTDDYCFKTKYFNNRSIMDDFIFSNDIYIVYIYNFKLHSYIFVGNLDEILEMMLYKLKKIILKECD